MGCWYFGIYDCYAEYYNNLKLRITVLCFYGTHVLITRTQNFTTSQAIHVQRRHHSGANRGMNILSWLCSSAIAFESVMWQNAGVSITDISCRLCLSFAFLPHWFNKFPIVLLHAFIFSGPAAFTQTRRIQVCIFCYDLIAACTYISMHHAFLIFEWFVLPGFRNWGR